MPLFDFKKHPGGESITPYAATEDDRKMLTGQNAEILRLLREGPQTNVRLAGVSLKYTSRISDLRAWLRVNEPGTSIACARLEGGLTSYSLVSRGVSSR